MNTTFRLNGDELTPSFFDMLRGMFAHKIIYISVSEEEPSSAPLGNPASPHGVIGKDLLRVIDALPRLSKENAESFAHDIREIRQLGNAPLTSDPWAS